MKKACVITASILMALVITLASGMAEAYHGRRNTERGYDLGLSVTLGESILFFGDQRYRGPVTLELVPSIGVSWFHIDLGLCTTLESLDIEGTTVGRYAFTFRPGGRVGPPGLPLYLRLAFPLQIQKSFFDWGILIGLGVDVRVVESLGIVFELNSTLSDYQQWGRRVFPLEFRAGLSFHF